MGAECWVRHRCSGSWGRGHRPAISRSDEPSIRSRWCGRSRLARHGRQCDRHAPRLQSQRDQTVSRYAVAESVPALTAVHRGTMYAANQKRPIFQRINYPPVSQRSFSVWNCLRLRHQHAHAQTSDQRRCCKNAPHLEPLFRCGFPKATLIVKRF